MEDIFDKLKIKLGEGLERNVKLADYSWLKIGGNAKYFFIAKNNEDIIKALDLAKELELDYHIISGGSNVIINSSEIDGLVIKLNNNKFEFKDNFCLVESGCLLDKIVDESINLGLSGLENLVFIPGTIGGAIYGNAGAYNKFIGDIVKEVTVYSNSEIKKINKTEINFGYRNSGFKNNKDLNKSIILSAVLEFKNDDKEKLRKIADDIIFTKQEKHPRNFPSLGCTFKNILLKPNSLELENSSQGKLKDSFLQEINKEKIIKLGYIPAGMLIEALDLKGYKIGGMQVSEKHGNFFINIGNATSDDFVMLVSYVKTQIRDNFGIQLENEIQFLGF